MSPTLRRVPVTELARFAGRSGDLGQYEFGALRGSEGIEVHQRLQRGRGDRFRSEVTIRAVWERGGRQMELVGRIDGVEEQDDGVVIEEIKTTRRIDDLPVDWRVHELQARMYAWMWRQTQGPVQAVKVRYAHPDPALGVRDRVVDSEAIDEAVDRACSLWLDGQEALDQWHRTRDASLRGLDFPFDDMRVGQERMAGAVHATLQEGGRLLVEAPTGIGKTLAVLWPTLRAMGTGQVDTILYTTSRNSGKTVGMEALRRLTDAGARVHAIPLEARERICTGTGSPCDVGACPLAQGFFDRLPDALSDLRTHVLWDRETWRTIADRHSLCPYAFQMMAAREADVVIGDLNYALAPGARLDFLFREESRTVLLVDEAHHLPDRSRAMISADLPRRRFRAVDAGIPPETRAVLTGPLRHVNQAILQVFREAGGEQADATAAFEAPERVGRACRVLADCLEGSLADAPPMDGDSRIDLYRLCLGFLVSLEHHQPSHVTFEEQGVLRHVCLDAGEWLRERLDGFAAVVMFSATLSPLPEFRQLVGARAEDRDLVLPSPFAADRFPVRIEAEIPVVWRERTEEMYRRLTMRLVDFVSAVAGRTLVFFPSYAMMEQVARLFPAGDLWTGDLQVQPRGLQEADTEAFLRPFREARGVRTGFAVLGGALNEGIDLPGEALNAVAVVTIGLPAVSAENEWIRAWHQEQGRQGFLMAYTLPGWIRVRQALGRVIRGPEDRGQGLLIDPRFLHPFYAPLRPAESEEGPGKG